MGPRSEAEVPPSLGRNSSVIRDWGSIYLALQD